MSNIHKCNHKYEVQFLLTLSEMCKFINIFIIEVIVKCGIYYIQRCFYVFFYVTPL